MAGSSRPPQDESTVTAVRRPAPGGLRVDHTHSSHQRRVAHAVTDLLFHVLEYNESVLAFTEAVELADLRSRAVFGGWWPSVHRVALVFTGRRLVEISLTAGGRRISGRVRSFPWDRVAGFSLEAPWLEIKTWAEASFRWYFRDTIDGPTQETLRTHVDLAVSTYQPAEMRAVPILSLIHI